MRMSTNVTLEWDRLCRGNIGELVVNNNKINKKLQMKIEDEGFESLTPIMQYRLIERLPNNVFRNTLQSQNFQDKYSRFVD